MKKSISQKNRVRELIELTPEESSKVKKRLEVYCGVSRQTVHRWFTMPEADIPLSLSVKIAEFFNVTVEEVAAQNLPNEEAK